MLKYIFTNSVLGICVWDLPALIVLVTLLVVFAVHRHKLKKEESRLEDQLSEMLAEETVQGTSV